MRAVWLVAACAASSVVALIAYSSQSHAVEAPRAREDPAATQASWCADGLEPTPDDACFAAPRDALEPTSLIVYLHGRYADAGAPEELDRQARLARLGTERGFAVLAIHGVRGECTSPEYKSHFCFPSNEKNQGDGPAFVARVSAAVAGVRAGLGPGPNVLLGFSNGGYFAALIATRALARFDAIVIAHGGPVEPTTAAGPMPPMLLITADDAAAPEMRKLDAELGRIGWPHALVSREGGHSLPDWDLDTAVTFFERTRAEGFPLVPPLASRPRSSVRDGGAEIAGNRGLDLRDL